MNHAVARCAPDGGDHMKLGLLTAPFPRRSLAHVATWAASEGFETLEIACWPAAGGERRRYAGTSHIDVARFDPGAVRELLDKHGLGISSLAYYPNNLHPDPAERRAAHTHLRKVIDAAARLGVQTVGTFVGRDKTKNVPDNFREFRRVWPRLVDYADSRGVRIAIENCPMIFSYDEWPGGTNLASTPAAWDEMFSIVDSPAFGLNLDPSHLVWLMIDYERVVRDYASKLFHVHAKDMEIDRDGLYRNGTVSLRNGLAGAAATGARRGALGPLHRRALSRRLRRRHLHRARGPCVRSDRGARQARLPHRPGRASAPDPLTPLGVVDPVHAGFADDSRARGLHPLAGRSGEALRAADDEHVVPVRDGVHGAVGLVDRPVQGEVLCAADVGDGVRDTPSWPASRAWAGAPSARGRRSCTR